MAGTKPAVVAVFARALTTFSQLARTDVRASSSSWVLRRPDCPGPQGQQPSLGLRQIMRPQNPKPRTLPDPISEDSTTD